MRVANIRCLQMERWQWKKFGHFPSESVSGGFSNVRSADCPGLKSNPAGFSRWKAMVPSAASALFRSLDGYADTGISSGGMMRFTAGIRPSAIERTTRAGPLSNRARRVAWKAGRLRGAKVLEALCQHGPDST